MKVSDRQQARGIDLALLVFDLYQSPEGKIDQLA